MKEEIENKWECWAANLHGENTESDNQLDLNSVEENDKKVVERIFEVRGKVSQSSHLKSEATAWKDLKQQLAPKQIWREFMKYAAIIVISLLLGGSAFWTFTKMNTSMPEYASITSPNGQISNVTLFDGTNIWLNAGSTLKYQQNFNKENREVFLEGEAFFDVIKNVENPFVVNAGNTQIEVLGTEFNVKAYPNDPQIETVLVEGSVQFRANNKTVLMKKGEHLLFSESNGRITKTKVITDEFTAWKGGKIYFNNEKLENLTKQLERWYEVKFTFNQEHIKDYRFTGVINTNKTLQYTLQIIEQINKVDFKMNNEQIEIVDKK